MRIFAHSQHSFLDRLDFGTKVLLARLVLNNDGQHTFQRPPDAFDTVQQLLAAGLVSIDKNTIRLVGELPKSTEATLLAEVPLRYLSNERG